MSISRCYRVKRCTGIVVFQEYNKKSEFNNEFVKITRMDWTTKNKSMNSQIRELDKIGV